ncbi:hypothetical protein D3C80_1250470 [compost metagenome]
MALGPYSAEAAPGINSAFSRSSSVIPTILPTEKFSPGAWLSIPSIICTIRVLPFALKPRVLTDLKVKLCVLISTPFKLANAS